MDSLKKNLSFHLKEYRKHNNLSQEKAQDLTSLKSVHTMIAPINQEKRQMQIMTQQAPGPTLELSRAT